MKEEKQSAFGKVLEILSRCRQKQAQLDAEIHATLDELEALAPLERELREMAKNEAN